MTPNNQEQKLRSLIQEAHRKLRSYEEAMLRVDKDATSLPALRAEMEKWKESERLLQEIDKLRIDTPDLSPELKKEIKKLDDAVESNRAKAELVLKGQRQQAEALSKADNKEQSGKTDAKPDS